MMKSLARTMTILFVCLPHAVASETVQPNSGATCDTLASYTSDALTSKNIQEASVYIQTAYYIRERSGEDCHSLFFNQVVVRNPSIFAFSPKPSLGVGYGGYEHVKVIVHDQQEPEEPGWNHSTFNELWEMVVPEEPNHILSALRNMESSSPMGWDYEKYNALFPVLNAQTPEFVFQKLGITTPGQ